MTKNKIKITKKSINKNNIINQKIKINFPDKHN